MFTDACSTYSLLEKMRVDENGFSEIEFTSILNANILNNKHIA